MKHLKIIIAVVIVVFPFHGMVAQWDVPVGLHWMVKNYYNPSFAGEKDKAHVSAVYRQDGSFEKQAPQYIFVNASLPVKWLGKTHGVGFLSHMQRLGDGNNVFFGLQYAYQHRLKRGTLQMGIQTGMWETAFDAASVKMMTDSLSHKHKWEAKPLEKKLFDLSAGISWTTKKYYAALSVKHFNAPSYYSPSDEGEIGNVFSNDSLKSQIPVTYNFFGGCNIPVFHTLFEIEPKLFVNMQSKNVFVDGALSLTYNKKYSAGLSWNNNGGKSYFGALSLKEVEIGYMYSEKGMNGFLHPDGCHEVAVRYQFEAGWMKTPSQPHKSIRLL